MKGTNIFYNRLNLHTYTCKKDKNDVTDMLYEISNIDADFCGDNGEHSLWEEAKSTGYTKNCDYLIDKLYDIENLEEFIERFVDEFLLSYSTYYDEYQLSVKEDNDKFYIALAYTINV